MDQRVFETKSDPSRYFVCRQDDVGKMVQYIVENYIHGKAKKALFHHQVEPCGALKDGIAFFDDFILSDESGAEFVKLR